MSAVLGFLGPILLSMAPAILKLVLGWIMKGEVDAETMKKVLYFAKELEKKGIEVDLEMAKDIEEVDDEMREWVKKKKAEQAAAKKKADV